MVMTRSKWISVIIGLIVGLIIGWFIPVHAADRCVDYVPEIRTQHIKHFGLQFPYWYGVAQLKQESRCRANLTSFDGGMGIAQFMPATAREVSAQIGKPLDPYRPEDGIRMQAFYMGRLHRQNPTGRLWATYQAYNGGWGNLRAEASRAGGWDRSAMYAKCNRKTLQLKSGPLSLCDVNYDYAARIFSGSSAYRMGADKMRYW